ncbi:MAG: glutathione S-transferase N-terminal domain-containing protein [Actinomycetota bacterium]|nr:glutathione S-transferase N-terminal domain-containing protein [Actinomycetota bacterium]
MGERAKLYVIRGSHAARAGILMLDHKGIDYDLTTIPTGSQRLLRLRGFPGGTVPALVIDGRKVQTNRAIARALDEIQPDPPLLPSDPERRAAVEEAERWSDEQLQMDARRLAIAGGLGWSTGFLNGGDDGPLGALLWTTERRRKRGLRLLTRVFDVTPETERELLDRLPAKLDRVDGWIEAGVLDGDELNAADYAIASNLALLSYRDDLRPEIARRPAGRLVARVFPPAG